MVLPKHPDYQVFNADPLVQNDLDMVSQFYGPSNASLYLPLWDPSSQWMAKRCATLKNLNLPWNWPRLSFLQVTKKLFEDLKVLKRKILQRGPHRNANQILEDEEAWNGLMQEFQFEDEAETIVNEAIHSALEGSNPQGNVGTIPHPLCSCGICGIYRNLIGKFFGGSGCRKDCISKRTWNHTRRTAIISILLDWSTSHR